MPLFSAVIAMVFLAERLAVFHVVGGLLILAGVIMAQR
jgi:drug/metabolite transporter (DMT)-like permease